MSVKIKNLHLLNSNCYDKIVIREEGFPRSDYQVNVIGSRPKYSTIPMTYSFSDTLKEQSDEDKIRSIIEHFLRYSKVDKICQNEHVNHYKGKFQVVLGNRELDFRLCNPNLRDIIKKIEEKYQNDRLAFCDENKDVQNILLYDTVNPSYEKGNDYLRFYLLINRGELANHEKDFLKELIYSRFCEIGETVLGRDKRAYINLPDDRIVVGGWHFTCGSLNIWVNSQRIADCVLPIVGQYNREKEMVKKKQLKLEGF